MFTTNKWNCLQTWPYLDNLINLVCLGVIFDWFSDKEYTFNITGGVRHRQEYKNTFSIYYSKFPIFVLNYYFEGQLWPSLNVGL